MYHLTISQDNKIFLVKIYTGIARVYSTDLKIDVTAYHNNKRQTSNHIRRANFCKAVANLIIMGECISRYIIVHHC